MRYIEISNSNSIMMRTFYLFILLLLHITGSYAIEPDAWKDITYSYRNRNNSLRDVLLSFSKTMGLELQMSSEMSSSASDYKNDLAVSPKTYLDNLSSIHQFQWFVYSGVLYISSLKERQIEIIHLGRLSADAVKKILIGIGIFEEKFGWNAASDSGQDLIISGPRSYLSLVKVLINKTIVTDKNSHELDIMIFPLKHASAADFPMTIRDKVSTLPGVATMLKNLIGEGKADVSGNFLSSDNSFPELDLKGLGPLANLKSGPLPVPSNGEQALSSPRGMADKPRIEAYAPLNAIVVRDYADKQKIYESLVKFLDKKPRQIEILASIVDIQKNKLNNWSVGLDINSSNNSVGLSANTQSATNSSASGGGQSIGTGSVLLWARNQLNIRLNALAAEGAAQVLLSPSILTLENTTAILDFNQTEYFQLVGERIADLKSVTVGTMLKVTPRIFDEEDGSSIRIMVEIEEGDFQASAASPTNPQTSSVRGTISTQAIVRPNEALVIGGYRRDSSEKSDGRVPGFASLPIIGRLFQSNSAVSSSRERVLVISAREINPNLVEVK